MAGVLFKPVGSSITLDTDAVSPDALKAAIDLCMDQLAQQARARGDAVDWNTFEFAQRPQGPETTVICRASVVK